MVVREILSAIPGGLKTLIRSWMAMRWGQRKAKQGEKVFKHTLEEMGMPDEVVADLTETYTANSKYLSIRYLSKLAIRGASSGWQEVIRQE